MGTPYRLTFHITLWLTVMVAFSLSAAAQPGRLHSENKKAIKSYRKAMESIKAALAPGADDDALMLEVEAHLLKALELDPEFSEAERILAGMRFEEGVYAESRDRYRQVLLRDGADWIRDHFAWAEAARHALDPKEMGVAMMAMLAIPGVMEGPDTARIDRVLADAEFMRHALAHPEEVDPQPLPFAVSTPQDEYFPSLWLAGEGLVFTRRVSDRRFAAGQEDLFISLFEEGEWQEAVPLRGLNTPNNEGAATLSGDGSTLCFTMCREADRPGEGDHKGSCDLYVTRRTVDGRWQRPVNLGPVNSGNWESQPSLSPDGRTLYFTRGRGRPGRRQHDLYEASVQSDGSFSRPRRLPDGINTPAQEMRPFLHPDGRHLYFASDGHVGMGGLDLFVSERGADGQWQTPVNLGYPLNTPEDESGLVVASDGKTGFFSRSVEGQLDLHSFILPPSVSADPTAALEGTIQSTDGRRMPEGTVKLLDGRTGEPFAVGQTGADARYHIPIPSDRDFVLLVEAPGHLFESVRIEAGTLEGRSTRDFALTPLQAEAEVVLRNVFFTSGSAELTPKSQPELREVAAWLQSNPGVQLEVEGHTDDIGTAEANLVLSSRRSESVRNFLIEAGADAGQLTAVGYGQTRPAVEGKTEEARRQNRRTSLRVVGLD